MPILSPSSMSSAPYQKSVTVQTVAEPAAIAIVKASRAQQLLDRDTLDGGPFRLPRSVSVTTRPGQRLYACDAGEPIRIFGEGLDGVLLESDLYLTNAHGGETVVSTVFGFIFVLGIQIPAQPSDEGELSFGIWDIATSFRALRCGGGGLVTYRCALDNTVDTIEPRDGETLKLAGSVLYGATTATKISIYA